MKLKQITNFFTLHPIGAIMDKIKNKESEHKIKNIGITIDKITGRGGLAFFLRYLEKIRIFDLLERRI